MKALHQQMLLMLHLAAMTMLGISHASNAGSVAEGWLYSNTPQATIGMRDQPFWWLTGPCFLHCIAITPLLCLVKTQTTYGMHSISSTAIYSVEIEALLNRDQESLGWTPCVEESSAYLLHG